ncbi:potassium-transporting ATPase subunit KdpC [Halopseudomonas sp.]|uniref:potassium-transporting ATPase subunit KdpC n=1 Tax=Halopseudomonas sp. TaxID=2901191 RepID=UPI003002FED3
MFKQIRPAVTFLALATLLTGVVYPLTVTAIAQLAFAEQANGSLVTDSTGQVRGSHLLAQAFAGEQWFQSRPSAVDYAASASGGSNLAPSNPAFRERISAAASVWQEGATAPVPMALVTSSASGLDPDLPPAAARYQVQRIAAARGIPPAQVEQMILRLTRTPLIGPPTVNVLALNQALADNLSVNPSE